MLFDYGCPVQYVVVRFVNAIADVPGDLLVFAHDIVEIVGVTVFAVREYVESVGNDGASGHK